MWHHCRVTLELRPNCEYCDIDLAPDSIDAWICTYECTFCTGCVEGVLANVCPNCGGGFARRPIRPSVEHRPGLSLALQQASTTRIHLSYSSDEIAALTAQLRDVPSEQR